MLYTEDNSALQMIPSNTFKELNVSLIFSLQNIVIPVSSYCIILSPFWIQLQKSIPFMFFFFPPKPDLKYSRRSKGFCE